MLATGMRQLGDILDPALIIRYTRMWLHYGAIGFVVFCTFIGAVRGLTERW